MELQVAAHAKHVNVMDCCWQAFEGKEDNAKEALPSILGGKPVLALAFDDMEMVVNAPKVVQLPERRGTEQEPVMA